jgi:hypothetical protein
MTKQFKAPRNTKAPLDFELTYERLIDGEWEEQTDKFKARGQIAGHLMMRIAGVMDSGVSIQAAEMITLLNSAVLPEYRPAFMKLIDDNDVAIPIETLGEILEWLAEEYTERPTQSA